MQEFLWQWSAGDLATAIREKQVSSLEVVQAHLQRIEAVNHRVNAVTVVLEESALVAAREADRRIAAGEAVGPLHGVPITLKENLDLAGSATTFGVAAYKDAVPPGDVPVVAHLKRAGAIPIGRTNLPDFGLRWHTDNSLHGATLNPWDPSRTPGGSSGGEAAAIATGMSPLGIGNDMGGSLRYPAQCCGIAAIRPSLGRVSRRFTSLFPDPPLYYEQVAAVNGPLARRVVDLRLALEVLRQPDPSDPLWSPAPMLGAGRPGPVKVAVTTDPSGDGVDPQIAAGVRAAAVCLADAGYLVEERDPPAIDDAARTIELISGTEISGYLDDILPVISAEAGTFLEHILALGGVAPDPAAFMAAIAEHYRIAQDWSLFMDRYPLILGPVSTLQPFDVGYDVSGIDALARFVRSLRLTETCNLLGLPSVSVPVALADGLPQGVQVIGWRYHEDLCFDAAEIIEQALGVFTPIEPPAAGSLN